MAEAGYSGTPLPKKLGLKDGQRVLFVGLPESLEQLEEAALYAGVEMLALDDNFEAAECEYDFCQIFVVWRDDLDRWLDRLKRATKPDGMIWVSWPKKASKVETDMVEDQVRASALPMGLVDVKVCAVDAVWSGLKLVLRKHLRQ
ncbi:MAG: DUF3052 family protein [Hyphomicrobiaceae bacterium]|nr:DUF3052 family protein [Hyphomicrobiaceae bacterium]MCC0024370.1 DUF3052 family protein [Hyphomicrobiaceae bacterium]